MQNNLARQSVMKQIGFVLAIASSIALGAYILMWSQSPNYQILFSGLAANESFEIVEVLQQSGIGYKLDHDTGTVMVPASKVESLKIKLATRGLPRSVSPGMAMFNQELEQNYIRRIENILAPIVGLNGVRAQVAADVDFIITEHRHEHYNPDIAMMRNEQPQEVERVGSAGTVGVPDTLSKQSDDVTEESVIMKERQNSDSRQNNWLGSSSKQMTRNFEFDRTIKHTCETTSAAIRKLSVAVLVDERREPGATESTPLSDAEMSRISTLVMHAIGFNKARGDSLNIVNAKFITPVEPEPLPKLTIWQQPWVWDAVKQVFGALLLLLLILGVMRPAFRYLNIAQRSEEDIAGPPDGKRQAMSAEGVNTMSEQAPIITGSERLEGQLKNVRSIVQQEPEVVAQVVKNWIVSKDD